MVRLIYYLLILFIVAGFAVYDIYKKRVPNKALVLFLPVAFAAPVIDILALNPGLIDWLRLGPMVMYAFAGAAAGFIILLSAAVASKSGNGIGGGDIKLIAVLGFIYGITGIICILIISSLLAAISGLCIKRKSGNQILRLPFVPFILTGVFAATALLYF